MQRAGGKKEYLTIPYKFIAFLVGLPQPRKTEMVIFK